MGDYILRDDGKRILVKGGPEITGQLPRLGFDIRMIPPTPMILRTPFDIQALSTQPMTNRTPEAAAAQPLFVHYDACVEAMINQVQQNKLYDQIGNLSGVNAVNIGRSPYNTVTRENFYDEPMQKATQLSSALVKNWGFTAAWRMPTGLSQQAKNIVAVYPMDMIAWDTVGTSPANDTIRFFLTTYFNSVLARNISNQKLITFLWTFKTLLRMRLYHLVNQKGTEEKNPNIDK